MILFTLVSILFLVLRQFIKWSIRKCDSKTSLEGKTVIVTAANSGIGYEIAFKLAAKGARTILACRSLDKGNTARASIIAETGNSNVILKILDLASLDSIRKFAEEIVTSGWPVHVLVNNARTCSLPDDYTEEGVIEGMQINHYGSFLLTLLLLPALQQAKPSRIVNVSSLMYIIGRANVDNLNKPSLNRIITYANSKLCNLIFYEELARKLKGTGITVNSMYPGIVQTNTASDAYCRIRTFYNALCWFVGRTPADGAETAVYLAIAEELENVTGEFFMDCKSYPVLPGIKDTVLAEKIWKISEKCVKYEDDFDAIISNSKIYIR